MKRYLLLTTALLGLAVLAGCAAHDERCVMYITDKRIPVECEFHDGSDKGAVSPVEHGRDVSNPEPPGDTNDDNGSGEGSGDGSETGGDTSEGNGNSSDGNNGHGNDADGHDESNPGKGKGKHGKD